MFLYSQISCKVIGKVLYNSTFKGRENGPLSFYRFKKFKRLQMPFFDKVKELYLSKIFPIFVNSVDDKR